MSSKKFKERSVIPVPQKVFDSIKEDFEERGVIIEKKETVVIIEYNKKKGFEIELRYDKEQYYFLLFLKDSLVFFSQDIDDIIDFILI